MDCELVLDCKIVHSKILSFKSLILSFSVETASVFILGKGFRGMLKWLCASKLNYQEISDR